MVKQRILHITPHMGGGIGNVISGIVSAEDNFVLHEVVLLEQPINKNFFNLIRDIGVDVVIQPSGTELTEIIKKSDVVIIHWWNHPKTARLLYFFPKVAARIIIWSHISNLTVPALSPQILLESTMVWFTSPASCNAPVFQGLFEEVMEQKTRVVPGCSGLDDFPDVEHKEHDGYTIGYLGYVDFSKLHPEYIPFCKAVDVPEARFVLAGDAPAKDILIRQAKEQKVHNHFHYLGYLTNIHETLSSFDVFGYPLMPSHTCTTENAILEAMAAKVPPVLLNQLTERFIVKDGETGILVSNKEEYGNAIRYLLYNPDKRKKMGMKARDYVLSEYSRKSILRSFYSSLEIAMMQPKKMMHFEEIMGCTPAEWFISCLGQDGFRFRQSFLAGVHGQTKEIKSSILDCSPLLKGESKSSVFQYEKEFPFDPMLKMWAKILMEESDNHG